MSYANGTPFLNLPQTVGTDHRDWFDTNSVFLALDAKMKTLWDGATATADILEQLQETVSGLDTDVSALQTVVDGHTTTLQTVNESLVLINSALSALNTDVHTKFDSAGVADPYDSTYGIYAVGDVVTYNGQRYKCVTAVTAAEPFDADKWLAEDIQTVIDNITPKIAMTITNDQASTVGDVLTRVAAFFSSLDNIEKVRYCLMFENITNNANNIAHVDNFNNTDIHFSGLVISGGSDTSVTNRMRTINASTTAANCSVTDTSTIIHSDNTVTGTLHSFLDPSDTFLDATHVLKIARI